MVRITLSCLTMIKRLFAVALLGAYVGLTQANQVSEFTESYSETVKVSGQFLKGLQFTDVDYAVAPHLYLPSAYQGPVCIYVSSADGRYKSQYQYTFTEPTEGLVSIEFPTQYIDELEEFSPGELGLLATAQQDCSSLNGNYLVGSWGVPKSMTSIAVFLRSNARRDVATILGNNDSENKTAPITVKCQDLRSNYRVSYDKECVLQGVDASQMTRVIIKRRNLRAMPDEVLELFQ